MDEHTQARLAGQRVVYLETGFAELAKRVGLDRARPLLIGTNPRAQLKALLEQRLPVYDRLAWLTVSTDGRDPDEIAAEIAVVIEGAPSRGRQWSRPQRRRAVTATRIAVGGERPYEVVVGTGVLTELPSLMGDQVRNVVVIHSAGLPGVAAPVCQALASAGYAVRPEPVPDGEAAKEIGVAAGLVVAACRGRRRAHRRDRRRRRGSGH